MSARQSVFGPPSCPAPGPAPGHVGTLCLSLQPGDAPPFAMARCSPCLHVSLQSISQGPVSATELYYLLIYFNLFFYLFLMANLACFCPQKGDHPCCNLPVSGARLLAAHAAAPPGGHRGRELVSPAQVPPQAQHQDGLHCLGTTASEPPPGLSLLAER